MARVVHKLAEAYDVQPGEILVCRETDPGWTALFGLAAGLVLDTFAGGMLSHAAIVAREYQLPTVVRAEGILASVRTGQVLAIDGTTGAVALVQS
jgi:phosphoenolpyruvate synthase/pyruvate phosphate dikinase